MDDMLKRRLRLRFTDLFRDTTYGLRDLQLIDQESVKLLNDSLFREMEKQEARK